MSQHTYTFDVKLFATVRVDASSVTEARRKLSQADWSVQAGFAREGDEGGVEWIDCTSSADGAPDLIEVDGEAT
jgi:hypothetical protein